MINKVAQTPSLSNPSQLNNISSISSYLTNLFQSLFSAFVTQSATLNALVDQNNVPTEATTIAVFTKTTLPSAATEGIIIVSNDVGGLTLAYSDGTNWRRVADRNIIS